MEILNSDVDIPKSERYQRFNDLVNLDLPQNKHVLGQIKGANLLWIRACFEGKYNQEV